jgi:hypothetical protein
MGQLAAAFTAADWFLRPTNRQKVPSGTLVFALTFETINC